MSDQKTTDQQKPEFLECSEAVTEICEALHCSSEEAMTAVADNCAAGLVRSLCREWITYDYDEEEPERAVQNEPVPRWFWEGPALRPETKFDWRNGRAAALTYDSDRPVRINITGLQFDRSGVSTLIDMAREEARSPEITTGLRVSGRQRNSEKWDAWIAELVTYFHLEGVPDGDDAKGQDRVISAVERRLIERGQETLSRSTVQSATRATLLRIRSAEK